MVDTCGARRQVASSLVPPMMSAVRSAAALEHDTPTATGGDLGGCVLCVVCYAVLCGVVRQAFRCVGVQCFDFVLFLTWSESDRLRLSTVL